MASDDILQYYKRELSYLRTQGADFAQRYPKVAARLALHGTESLDPHTERLVEATAFLAARVHRDLDQAFPEIAGALLENVCPSLVQTIPSMTVAQFDLVTRVLPPAPKQESRAAFAPHGTPCCGR
jgi:type VI secretion system protein ImpG